MCGIEVLNHLLQIDPNVKAILTSGYVENDVIENYKKYGFKAFLKKPFFLDDLLEALNQSLEGV
jgi:CheY-like chemotaxis protein